MPTLDVVIVGGGIIGLSAAYRLAGEGRKVVVVERRRCGQEASWAGAGILSPCSWHRRDDLARIHMDSIFQYHDFVADVERGSGMDVGFKRCGKLRLILDDNRMKMARNEVTAVGPRRTPEGWPIVETLTPESARVLEPELEAAILGAQHCRMTAQVRNPRLLSALRVCCENLGVEILEGVVVRALLKEGSRACGVDTDRGLLKGRQTVVCGGAWSSGIDPQLARLTPVHPVRGQMILLHRAGPTIGRILEIEERHFYVVPRGDGHILVGSTEEHDSGFSQRTTARALARLTSEALDVLPRLADASVVRTWAGLRPGTPDRRPFVGPVPGLENLFVAAGHFRTGLTVAPVMAQIITDLLQHRNCRYDLAKCAPGRTFPPDPARGVHPG